MRSDALKNRERLLAAAGQVFEEKGLEASVADVAGAAGVGMGTLYRHFPSKEALVEALVSDVLETTIALARAAAVRPDGTGLEHFLRSTDISLALWSIRGVLETTGPNAPEAWKRHLDLLVAGMRPTDAELAQRPLSQNQVDRFLSRHEASAAAAAGVRR
jgi:AcrR family transcriptional regulator